MQKKQRKKRLSKCCYQSTSLLARLGQWACTWCCFDGLLALLELKNIYSILLSDRYTSSWCILERKKILNGAHLARTKWMCYQYIAASRRWCVYMMCGLLSMPWTAEQCYSHIPSLPFVSYFVSPSPWLFPPNFYYNNHLAVSAKFIVVTRHWILLVHINRKMEVCTYIPLSFCN
jgi:hypothetical protein